MHDCLSVSPNIFKLYSDKRDNGSKLSLQVWTKWVPKTVSEK